MKSLPSPKQEKEETNGPPGFYNINAVPHDVQVLMKRNDHNDNNDFARIQTNEQDIFKMSETSSVNSDSEYPSRSDIR